MHPIKILAKGKFGPDDITVTVSPSNRKIDPAVESQLDALWEKKLAKALAAGKNIYNGISYRLNSLEEKAGKLHFDLSTFDYKTRDGLMEAEGYYNLSDEYLRKGCFTGASIRTSDHKFLMVAISSTSMNTNKTDLIGGIIEVFGVANAGSDIFKSLYREMAEEALITEGDIQESYLKAVYLNASTNCGMYFEVVLSISADELLRRFETQSNDADIKGLIALTREEYCTALEGHNESKKFIRTILEI